MQDQRIISKEAGVLMAEWQPVWLSIKVALASLIFVVIFGVLFAHAMRKWEFGGKAAVEAIFALPLVLPPVPQLLVLLPPLLPAHPG